MWRILGSPLPAMARKLHNTLPALLITLVLCSCQAGPQARTKQNPAIYNRLSAKDKELVARGDIRKGMSKDAVYLSWGPPGMVREGSSGSSSSEAWAYMTSAPIPTSSLSYANVYRPYYGRYGVHPRYGYCRNSGWALETGTDFVRYVSKTVKFSGNRVVSWERVR